jgi:uridine kinase
VIPSGSARVVIVSGPSGSGKSRLAARLHAAHGWPIVRLDDFYRNGDDPALPMTHLGGTRLVDWDDPASWDAEAAVQALSTLVHVGRTEVPVYDLGQSRIIGSTKVTLGGSQLTVAEGIFAAEIIGRLSEEGLLHSAWCIAHNRWITFARRLVRDLSERRKPPHILLRRGLALCRDEPRIVARMERLGARCTSPSHAESALAAA